MVSFFCMAASDNTCFCTYCRGHRPLQPVDQEPRLALLETSKRLITPRTLEEGSMLLHVNTASRLPIYQQLAHQIREAIARGELQPDARLPSVRQLSRELVVNPNTVARAYTELEREGLLVSRPGRGIYVAQPRNDLTRAARD